MNRQNLIQLESSLQLLLLKYKQLQEEVVTLRNQVTSQDKKLKSSRRLIEDLKEQLNKVQTDQSQNNKIQKELDDVQEKVLQLINEVDNCIKAIQ